MSNPQTTSYYPTPIEPPTPLERIGRGMTDVFDGPDRITDYLRLKLGLYTPAQFAQKENERNDDSQLYNKGTRGQHPAADAWRSFCGIAAAMPLA